MGKKKTIIEAINTSKLLTLSEKRVLIGIVSFWKKAKTIYASHSYLSKNWGISESSVKRAISIFNRYGLIKLEVRKGNTNIITPKMGTKELIEYLSQTDFKFDRTKKAKDDYKKSLSKDELGDDKEELSNGQDELGSKVKKDYNTVSNTETNIEDNTKQINSSDDLIYFLELIDECQTKGETVEQVFQQFREKKRKQVVGYGNITPNGPLGYYLEFKTPIDQKLFDRNKFLLVSLEDGFKEITSNYC